MLLHLDFETRSACDLREAGLHVYAEHPTTDIWLASYAFGDEPVKNWFPGEPVPGRLKDFIEEGGEVWGHNVPFEFWINNKIAARKYGWPVLQLDQVFDTMAQCYAMALPGSLEKAAAALGIEIGKDMVGHRLMMQMAQPREMDENCPTCRGTGIALGARTCHCVVWWPPEGKLDRLAEYGRQDVVVERLIHERTLALPPRERDLWILDQKINARGVQVDLPSVRVAMELVGVESKRLDEQMREVTGNRVASCRAVADLTRWIKSFGLDVDGVAKADVTLLLENPNLPEACRKALLTRQEAAKSSTAKLKKMISGVNADGRIRGCFQYWGAQATGRWAGRRVQLQNLPRPNLKQKEIEEVFELFARGAA